jgi:hypothetical protein
MAASENVRIASLVVAAAAVSFVLVRGSGPSVPGSRAASPDDAAPAGAFLVASLDVEALRAARVLDAVLGTASLSRTIPVPGVSAAADACGFDPLARVRSATLAVPEDSGDRGDFGLAARLEVTDDELRTCVTRLSEKRGVTPTTRKDGSFLVLDAPPPPPRKEAAAGDRMPGPAPAIAYGAGGLLLVGQGAWLGRMMRAAEGTAPSAAGDTTHGTLRATLTAAAARGDGDGDNDDGWRAPMLLVTMVLPRALRDRLRGEMAEELADAGGGASAAGGASMMSGVLGVASAGLALRHVHGEPSRIEARAELVCDDDASCRAVETLLGKKRLDWSKDIALRLVGVGKLTDALRIERSGARVQVRASFETAAVTATVEGLLRLGSSRRAPR